MLHPPRQTATVNLSTFEEASPDSAYCVLDDVMPYPRAFRAFLANIRALYVKREVGLCLLPNSGVSTDLPGCFHPTGKCTLSISKYSKQVQQVCKMSHGNPEYQKPLWQ